MNSLRIAHIKRIFIAPSTPFEAMQCILCAERSFHLIHDTYKISEKIKILCDYLRCQICLSSELLATFVMPIYIYLIHYARNTRLDHLYIIYNITWAVHLTTRVHVYGKRYMQKRNMHRVISSACSFMRNIREGSYILI